MPYWCEGVLKVRGKRKDLKKFISIGITRNCYDKYFETKEIKLNSSIDEYGELTIEHTDVEFDSWLHITNTTEMFIETDVSWYLSDCEEDEEQIQYLDIKQAWDIDTDELSNISKTFNIDFRITGIERGMCFTRDIEIRKGTIILDERNKYDDCEKFNWEVFDPRLGG